MIVPIIPQLMSNFWLCLSILDRRSSQFAAYREFFCPSRTSIRRKSNQPIITKILVWEKTSKYIKNILMNEVMLSKDLFRCLESTLEQNRLNQRSFDKFWLFWTNSKKTCTCISNFKSPKILIVFQIIRHIFNNKESKWLGEGEQRITLISILAYGPTRLGCFQKHFWCCCAKLLIQWTVKK